MSAVPKRLKRVSWAPEPELRQERLFVSDDAPAISGFGIKDHLKAKSSLLWHSTASVPGEPLTPGPEVPHPSKKHKDAFQIPLIKWKCPNKLVLNSQWMVVAGEDSTEVQTQTLRQLGTLEAIYPRLTSIPANPFTSPKEEDCEYDDSATPIVPLIAIEDEETDPSYSTVVDDYPKSGQTNVPEKLLTDGTPQTTVKLPLQQHIQENTSPAIIPKQRLEYMPGVEPDVAAAASAVYTAIMKFNDDGNMIDRELLIEILSDPTTIEKLISNAGAPKQSSPQPQVVSPASPPKQLCHGAPLPAPPPPLFSKTSSDTAEFTTGKPLRETSQVKDPSCHKNSMPQHDTRDVTYLKRLVHQHGGEGGAQESSLNFFDKRNQQGSGPRGRQVDASKQVLKRRDFKPRNPVPCAFFNSPKGCKNGSKCSFLHDTV